jgi:sporulation and spore germination protein
MRGRHLLGWVALVAVLTAGCGIRPSGVITGGPAPTNAAVDAPPTWSASLYLVTGSALAPVIRPTPQRLSPTEVLALLQEGPADGERAAGLTSEVPAGLGPVSVTTDASGTVEVVVSADVTALSGPAVDQIVCTVRDALTTTTPTTAPTTLTGGGATRGPRTCPVPG